MKKYLLVISFVLISLLAVGAVSASDDYNLTDDSVIPLASEDDGQMIGEEQDIQNPSDALSGGENDTPSVDVEDITANEGDIVAIPFNVTNSDGSLVSGGVNVTLSGEKKTASEYIELNNVTGQSNFTIIDLIEIIKANGGNVSEIYEMIGSSSNFTNVNVSQIVDGLYEINSGWSVNVSQIVEGSNLIANGTYINHERLLEGIKEILSGFKLDFADFINGYNELTDSITVNGTNMSIIKDCMGAVIGGFTIDETKLLNGILSAVTVDPAVFGSFLTGVIKEFLGGSSKASDLLSKLGINLSLKLDVEILSLLAKKETSILDFVKVGKDILDYNHLTPKAFLERLSGVTNGFTYNLSDIINALSNPSSSSIDYVKLIKSVKIDYDKIASSFAEAINGATFDKSKVANEVAAILNVDANNLLKVIDGLSDIFQGFKVNTDDVYRGLMEVFSGLASGNSNTSKSIFSAISFNEELFTADLDKFLSGFNFSASEVSAGISDFVHKLNLTIPDELEASLSESLSVDKLNFTRFGIVFEDILTYNNLTHSNLSGITNDIAVNLSKLVYRIADHTFNATKALNMIYKIMHYVTVDYEKIASSISSASEDINSSRIINGMSMIIAAVKIDTPMVIAGLDKIVHGADLNKAKLVEVIELVMGNVDVNASKFHTGISKIINAISIKSKSSIVDGLVKVVSSFAFDHSRVYKGINEIFGAFRFDNSMISLGIYNVCEGMGLNVSEFAGKFVSRFGYIATFTRNLPSGIYNVTVAYVNGEVAANDTSKLTIIPKLSTPIKFDVAVDGYDVNMTVNVDPNAKGLVLIQLDGFDVYNLIVDGKVEFNNRVKPGAYDAVATYLGDENFDANSTAVSFIVKSPTTITASPVSVVYANTKNLVVTMKDYYGNAVANEKVTVTLNGKTYVRTTDGKGQISVALPSNLVPNTYTASIAFAGDDKYVKSSASVKVTVLKATPKITAKAKTFKKSVKTKKYTITLKNNKNKVMKNTKVTIKVKGKTYTAKTNSKGQATFKITKLTKKGTFKAVITYKGDKYYNKVTKNVNIKVK